jgi:WD40 repeat protein
MFRFMAIVWAAFVPIARADDDFRELKGHEGPTRAARFTPDGATLISCSGWPDGDKSIRIWDVKTGKEEHVLKNHSGQVVGLAVSKDGKRLLSGSHDSTVRVWDIETGKELLKFTGHGKSPGTPAVAFAPDGKTAASGDGNGKLLLWSVDTGKVVHELKGHEKDVRNLYFTPDGKALISSGFDGTIRTWDPTDGKEKKSIAAGFPRIEAIALTPDGKEVVAAGNRLIRFDLDSGKELKDYQAQALSVAVSPDGKKILSGKYGGEMTMRDLSTGQVKTKYTAHLGNCFWVEFAPDGKTVATAGGGGQLVDGKYQKGEDFVVRIWTLDE